MYTCKSVRIFPEIKRLADEKVCKKAFKKTL